MQPRFGVENFSADRGERHYSRITQHLECPAGNVQQGTDLLAAKIMLVRDSGTQPGRCCFNRFLCFGNSSDKFLELFGVPCYYIRHFRVCLIRSVKSGLYPFLCRKTCSRSSNRVFFPDPDGFAIPFWTYAISDIRPGYPITFPVRRERFYGQIPTCSPTGRAKGSEAARKPLFQ